MVLAAPGHVAPAWPCCTPLCGSLDCCRPACTAVLCVTGHAARFECVFGKASLDVRDVPGYHIPCDSMCFKALPTPMLFGRYMTSTLLPFTHVAMWPCNCMQPGGLLQQSAALKPFEGVGDAPYCSADQGTRPDCALTALLHS